MESIRQRDICKQKGDTLNFKRLRNQTNILIDEAKTAYYQAIIKANQKDQSAIWKYMKEISPNTTKSNPAMLKDNDKDITSPEEIANVFNEYFANISKNYITNTDYTDSSNIDTKLKEYVENKLKEDDMFVIPPVTEAFTLKQLLSLDTTKAAGLDGYPAKILKSAAPIIAKYITQIYNLSIQSGIFPDEWKTAKVIPLHKCKSLTDKANFRPISLLSIISKILERHVFDSTYAFLTHHNLLYDGQSGFRKNHSCETALLKMTSTWTEITNNGELNGIILLDMRKAFDLVNHEKLLRKLDIYHFSKTTTNWFSSYLNDRHQQVCFKGKYSDRLPVNTGVPQGSILGPLMFILFINDMNLSVENTTLDMYADDSTASTSAKTVPQLQEKLQTDMDNISNWCNHNKMVINADKTKSMLITTRQKRQSLVTEELNIQINGTTDSEKLLGVTIDNNMNWNKQIKLTIKKVSSKLALLKRIKKYLPLCTRILFYKAYILPHIDYCSTVWGFTAKYAELYKLQKRAARIITDSKFDADGDKLIKTLKWIQTHKRVKYGTAVMIYNTMHNTTPQYLRNIFKQKDIKRETRSTSKTNLYIPIPKRDVFKNSISYQGPLYWNSLPCFMKNSVTVNVFKKELYKYVTS